ncbi:hypothetical protein M378DRAFT_28754 [Amanita muscaria Koide BX008]|uniref:Uncharacterized protein n=1 Tax=Amanita muscaria (strain Koide BX008) TaxID=946122 RepID=A0A0C2VZU2_AMAMK|nr:hypothetical protein M378DRAFT_28754 [Amanita muscaria Koide BX008]
MTSEHRRDQRCPGPPGLSRSRHPLSPPRETLILSKPWAWIPQGIDSYPLTTVSSLLQKETNSVWLSPGGSLLVLLRFILVDPWRTELNHLTLEDVLNYWWMIRGFNGPPDLHLIRRLPLRAVDRNAIRRDMKAFEFGTEDEIKRKLIRILESDMYISAAQNWKRKRGLGPGYIATADGSYGPTTRLLLPSSATPTFHPRYRPSRVTTTSFSHVDGSAKETIPESTLIKRR